MEKNRKIVWGAVLLILILAALAGFFCFKKYLWPRREEQIRLGLASDKFPWRVYTIEELEQMHPQIKNANIPTRVTPEETYAKFREALRTNNLEMAVEQLAKEEKFENSKKDLESAFKEKRFSEIYQLYSEKISEETTGESSAQYFFEYTEEKTMKTHYVNFTKDANGDWKMSSL